MGEALLEPQELARLPLGKAGFAEIRNQDRVYVDKTALIGRLAVADGPYFLSRPRRFGKSLLLSTFESLFASGLEMFHGLALEKSWQEEKTYPVVRLNFASYGLDDLDIFKKDLLDDLKNKFANLVAASPYDDLGHLKTPGSYFQELLFKSNDRSLVLLIDEYDAPITHTLDDAQFNRKIITTLSSFFNVLKDYTHKCRFIFITGITRLAHVSLFSVFNNLEDLTLTREASLLLGITDAELHRYFDSYVKNAASVLDMSVEDVYSRLKTRYNGYCFCIEQHAETLYNPWSLLSFFKRPEEGFDNYWYQSSGGTPALLLHYLRQNPQAVDMMALRRETRSVDKELLTSKSEPLQIPLDLLLWQSGYYTLRYAASNLADLVFPNEEVEYSLSKLMEDLHHLGLSRATERGLDSLPALIDAQNLDAIEQLFNAILKESLSFETSVFEHEIDIRDVIYMKIPEKGLTKLRENHNVHGRSDLELKTVKTHLVIEFKRSYPRRSVDHALQEGIKQMNSRDYGEILPGRTLIRVVMVCSQKQHKIVLTQQVK